MTSPEQNYFAHFAMRYPVLVKKNLPVHTMVLLKKTGAGHFTKCAPGFLSRFHWGFLAQNLIFYVYQKKFKI